MKGTRSSRLPGVQYESALWEYGAMRVAGVDEAGRGPLAGPVIAAAVVFPYKTSPTDIKGVNDSKKISPEKREILYNRIIDIAEAVGIGIIDAQTIDDINILQATFRAMNAAVAQLGFVPEHLLIDGNRFAGSHIPHTMIVHGDELCFSIAAASIIAKVTRDRIMCAYHAQYPSYGFARHKGYGTREHYEALHTYGMAPIHRQTFVHLGVTKTIA